MSDLPSGMGGGRRDGGDMPSAMSQRLGGSAALTEKTAPVIHAKHFSAASLETVASLGLSGAVFGGVSRGAVLGRPSTRSVEISPPFFVQSSRKRDVVQITGPASAPSWTKRPKVSFITCSYNRPALLRIAVNSLLSQTDRDWEQLIVDDASTDPRVEEILCWAESDSRIRVWRRKQNIDAPSVLWNFMMDRAHGHYISVLDDDNEKLPRFVEILAGILDREPDIDLVTCGTVSINHKGEAQLTSPNMRTSAKELDIGNTCDGGAMLYRRELLDRVGLYTEAQRTNEDWDWFRRAVRDAKVKNIPESLATYRGHGNDGLGAANRMARMKTLGNDSDVASMMQRDICTSIMVQVYGPHSSRTVQSQKDVIRGVDNAIGSIPWMQQGNGDLAVIVLPFQIDSMAVADIAKKHRRILFVLVEDPSAVKANIERVRAATISSAEVWVCTNDVTVIEEYRAIVGDRVMLCPQLGVDETVNYQLASERDIDVLFCGYAYESRKQLLNILLPKLKSSRIVVVGDGWEKYKVEVQPTQGLSSTYALHTRAKTVVCFQRRYEDQFNGSEYRPQSVNRGFMEGYFGPRVFIDDTRKHHPYDPGDVVWYSSPDDLATKLNSYLSGPRDQAADRFAEKCALLYTYQARMERIINCVRSPRYLAEIP